MSSFNKRNGRGVSFSGSSLILTKLDAFTAYIYSLIKYGFFGFLFSGYPDESRCAIADRAKESGIAKAMHSFFAGVNARIETSVFVNAARYTALFLLNCKVRFYGVFFLSYGFYTAVVSAIIHAADGRMSEILDCSNVKIAVVIIVLSLPLMMSVKTLAEALNTSFIGRFVMYLTGFSSEDITKKEKVNIKSNIPMVLGMICGVFTYYISPLIIPAVAVLSVGLYLILIKPEIGVMLLFAGIPWLPTMVLAGIVIYTFLCWCLKLMRGRRKFRLEPVDITALAFIVILASGGFASVSSGSLKPALLMVCLSLGYFLTVELITSREWIVRCTSVCIGTAAIESVYAIVLYFLGAGYSSQAWLDDEMFSEISGRAVGSLDNPNMLGEYLIMIIPLAAAMFLIRDEGLNRIQSFVCLGAMGACLILTWSRGAWLGIIFAVLVFLFMWHYRSIWIILLGAASIPFLPSILPESIISRFTSIGNMSDSSTSYRVYIWRASVNMIEDNVLAGIGVGEDAWGRLYPKYSYQGIEAAPHSHNLFLQIWLELGVFGEILFVAFLLLLIASAFTLFRRLSEKPPLKTSDISAGMIYRSSAAGLTESEKMNRSRFILRMSVIGGISSLAALAVQGMTDYSWYNYRLYLMFWLLCGITSAGVRYGNKMIRHDGTAHNDETVYDTEYIVK